MGIIAGLALAATIYMVATGAGGGYVIIPILILIVFGIAWFVDEAGKDGQAYYNAREYWRKRGSGVYDRRTYASRRPRR